MSPQLERPGRRVCVGWREVGGANRRKDLGAGKVEGREERDRWRWEQEGKAVSVVGRACDRRSARVIP